MLGISQNQLRTSCIEASLRACRAKVVAAWSISPLAKLVYVRKMSETARANYMSFMTG